jgi:Tfp pilus assembly protein PilF
MKSQVRTVALIGALTVLTAAWIGCGGGGQASKKEPREPSTQELVRQAQSLLGAGRVSEALQTMDEALAKDPDNARLHSAYGTICFQAARYKEAEEAFLNALVRDPYLTDARNFLGAVYAQTGREAEAEEQFKKALRDPAYPTPEKVYLNLGLLYRDQGKDEEAVQQFRTAVEINPKFYQAHFELASTLDRLGRLAEAARMYEIAEPDYRQSAEYHYRLGFTYFRLGDKLRARGSLERARSVAPGSVSAARADEVLEMMD